MISKLIQVHRGDKFVTPAGKLHNSISRDAVRYIHKTFWRSRETPTVRIQSESIIHRQSGSKTLIFPPTTGRLSHPANSAWTLTMQKYSLEVSQAKFLPFARTRARAIHRSAPQTFYKTRTFVRCLPLLTLIGLTNLPCRSLAGTQLPQGFTESIFVSGGLDVPVSMDFSPDGRLFVCQKGGYGRTGASHGEAAVRVVKDGQLLPKAFYTLTVANVWECGLWGIAFDPNFGNNGQVYLSHSTTKDGQIIGRIVRVTASAENPDVADPNSAEVIVDDLPGSYYHNGGALRFGADGKLYYGTGFGDSPFSAQDITSPLGKILRYNRDGSIPSDNPFVETAGAFPAVWAFGFRNPFSAAVDPVEKGGTGMFLINDVGENLMEEVNELRSGRNYGWPLCEGDCEEAGVTAPLIQYSHQEFGLGPSNCFSAAITGGAFYRQNQFPSDYRGKYFVADYTKSWIKLADLTTRKSSDFALNANNPIDLKVGPDGSLYYLSAASSAYDGTNRSIYRISYNSPPEISLSQSVRSEGANDYLFRLDASGSSDPDGDAISFRWLLPNGLHMDTSSIECAVPRTGHFNVILIVADARGGEDRLVIHLGNTPDSTGLRLGISANSMPHTLSATGIFASLTDLTPNPALVPYEINTPLWSDGALKRRWLALPPGSKVRFSAVENWTFPPGTALIKHFELPPSVIPDAGQTRRLETRFFVRSVNGDYFGVTYKWRPDGADADLLAVGQQDVVETGGLPDGGNRIWDYPSREQCLQCHRTESGSVLGVNSRQLNRQIVSPVTGSATNQLRILSDLGVFDQILGDQEINALPQLKELSNGSASLEDRVRSYLDANCAYCHQPDSRGVHAFLDARYSSNLADQGLIDGALMTAQTLGLGNPKIVIPQTLEKWGSGSVLYMRMTRQDQFRMPPLGTHLIDTQAVEVVKQWIESLPLPPSTNSLRTSDILLQSPLSGDIFFWLADAGERQLSQGIPIGDPDWKVLGIDDFNGDLNQDLLWRHGPSGAMGFWITQPVGPPSQGSLPYVWALLDMGSTNSLDYVGSGDFDNNNESDLYWFDPDLRQIVVRLNRHGFSKETTLAGPLPFPAGWQPFGVADFDLDGQLDLVCENTATRQWGVWLMNGLTPSTLRVFDLEVSPTAQFLGVVDGNGDGYPDLHWNDSEQLEWFCWTIRDLQPLERIASQTPTGAAWRLLAPSMARDRLYPAPLSIELGAPGTIKLGWNSDQASRFFIQMKNQLQDPIWRDLPQELPLIGPASFIIDPAGPNEFFRLLRQNAAVTVPPEN